MRLTCMTLEPWLTPIEPWILNGQQVSIDDIEEINWEGSDDGEGFELADELWLFLKGQEEPIVVDVGTVDNATLAEVYAWIDPT